MKCIKKIISLIIYLIIIGESSFAYAGGCSCSPYGGNCPWTCAECSQSYYICTCWTSCSAGGCSGGYSEIDDNLCSNLYYQEKCKRGWWRDNGICTSCVEGYYLEGGGCLPIPTPPTPTATSATAVAKTSFSANWNASAWATGYWLDVSTQSNFSSYVSGYDDKAVGNVITSSVSGLSRGVTYYYRVRAINDVGTSGYSNTIEAATTALPSKIALTGPGSVIAGAVSTTFTLTSQDADGNAVDVTQDTVFDLTSDSSGTTFYSDSGGTSVITQRTISDGSSSATFYYKDTKAGTPTVTATHSSGMSLGSATHGVTVNAGTAGQVIMTGPSSVTAGSISTAFSLTSQDSNGNTSDVTQDTVFDLTSNSSGATFYSDSGGTSVITQTTISDGSSSATFYCKDTKAGTPTVTVTRSSGMSLGAANHGVTVNAGTAGQVIMTGPSSVTAGSISTAFGLTSLDANGNTSDVTGDTVFDLSSNSSGTIFYSDSGGTSVITQTTISDGSSSAAFYCKDTKAGTPTVTATRSSGMSLGSATHGVTVNAGTAGQVSLTGPSSVATGSISTAFSLTSQDAEGNAVDVTQDTVFDLTSNSTGTATFYRNAAGTISITRVIIPDGDDTAAFYYRDTKASIPTVTATRSSGMALGAASRQITVEAGTVFGTVFNDLNGNGIQDVGESGISSVTVKLLDNQGSVVITDATDGDGGYRFTSVSPGSYTVRETDPGGYSSTTSNSVSISVATGGSATANFGDQQQGTVSGTVFEDMNGNGSQEPEEPGIYDVVVKLVDNQGGVVQTERTNEVGNYDFSDVSAGSYTVRETDPDEYSSTTANSVPVLVAAGGSATAVFGDQAQGIVSGNVFLDANGNGVQDTGEPGIRDVTVKLLNNQGPTTQTDTTYEDGSYGFYNVTSGNYTVRETDPTGYASTTNNTVAVFLPTGGSATANFGDQAPETISGIVFHDANGNEVQDKVENGIAGATVKLLINGSVLLTTVTADNGSYGFSGRTAGTYTVEETDPDGYISTTDNRVDVTVGPGVAATANFGDIPEGTVSGVVFTDTNGNGVQDAGEKGIGGVTVNLLNNQDVVIGSMTTTGDGIFLFTNIPDGTYTVEELYPSGYTGTTSNRVVVTVGVIVTSESARSSVSDGAFAANFGVLQQKTVSGIVFNDLDGNGVQDPGENGVGGVVISLLDDQGSVVSTITTAGDGRYGFYDMAPGNYTVREAYPTGYTGDTNKSVPVTMTSEGAATANFGILQGEAPDHAILPGSTSVSVDVVSDAVTLTSKNGDGNTSNVTSDTVFSLSSGSSGVATFYSDAAGTTAITRATIANGTSTATFYYKDTATGTPTLTVAWNNGGTDLGSDTQQITVYLATTTLATSTSIASSFRAFKVTVTKIEMNNGANWVTIFSGAAELDLVNGGTFPGVRDLNLPTGTYSEIRVTFNNSFPVAGMLNYGGTTYYTTATTFAGQPNLASAPTTVAGSMAEFTFYNSAWGKLNEDVSQTFSITPVIVGAATDYQGTLRFTIGSTFLLKGDAGVTASYFLSLDAPIGSFVEP